MSSISDQILGVIGERIEPLENANDDDANYTITDQFLSGSRITYNHCRNRNNHHFPHNIRLPSIGLIVGRIFFKLNTYILNRYLHNIYLKFKMKYKLGYESIYSKAILWVVVLLAYCIFIRKMWNAYYMNTKEEICPECGEFIVF
ncbi:uncharacterized protein LOC100573561 [Acyrthosiphon pisum]|uniref:Uncharacterized protein n=1 Tax=Acyrthosiphon pisum TaxID=7029 RepID=A0A8R2JUQ5_ACYPI|nr:uncharacterized protein LOC100573561 [Acyrthosiphon pisum]XP_029347807.1 uncharacterized protein LOC100573561 [Acyrthosiphon pisum]